MMNEEQKSDAIDQSLTDCVLGGYLGPQHNCPIETSTRDLQSINNSLGIISALKYFSSRV